MPIIKKKKQRDPMTSNRRKGNEFAQKTKG
jgi:hypothetical protein